MARALVRACHPLPTLAVTVFIGTLAWAIGWPLSRLGGLLVVVLMGQLSVGWSNDAHDAALDRQSQRLHKPVATGHLSARVLWILALAMLISSIVGSWLVAGWLGGSFHVVSLLAAWAYNLRLSRTTASWVPYAVAFGCVPAFVSFGLDDQPPAWWLVAVAALIGISGHLSNASPDLDRDAEAGMGGLVVRLGYRRALALGWVLLAAESAILVGAGITGQGTGPLIGAGLVVVGFAVGLGWTWMSRSPQAWFHAVLVMTLIDLLALVLILRP